MADSKQTDDNGKLGANDKCQAMDTKGIFIYLPYIYINPKYDINKIYDIYGNLYLNIENQNF